jgi:hypothetical protein
MYMVVSFIFVYKRTDHCHRMETQLQLIIIVSYHTILGLYHIISYLIISYHITCAITLYFKIIGDG